MSALHLHNHIVGRNEPILLVAECGINHNGRLDMALQMIEAAAAAGVDAVKFQLFRAEWMYTPKAGLYRTAQGELVPIYELMKELELPCEWLPTLAQACRSQGLEFIMTVCDEWGVAQMDAVDFDAYKVASYELQHWPLLEALAFRNKPVFMSTGAATIQEVREAMALMAPGGKRPVGLLQCTAKYPAPLECLHLAVIQTFAEAFPNCIPGFSDHSSHPIKAPIQAVFHGAQIIEKHFTLDRRLPGADHSFAVEPAELRALVRAVRKAEKRLQEAPHAVKTDKLVAGTSEKRVQPCEESLRRFATRGIFSIAEIQPGERFTKSNIRVLRPGQQPQGLSPRHYAALLQEGSAARYIPPWTGLQPADVADVDLDDVSSKRDEHVRTN